MTTIIPDRYAAATDLAPEALLRIWRSIPVEQQEAIGTLALLDVMAGAVAEDDGLIASSDERDAATGPAQNGGQDLSDAIQAALPQVLWYYPNDYAYQVRDKAGKLIGTVETVKAGHVSAVHDTHQFRPALRRHRLGPKMEGEPSACLPEWVWDIINDGGWFGAMLPDGRRYPDDFRPINDPCNAPVIQGRMKLAGEWAKAFGADEIVTPETIKTDFVQLCAGSPDAKFALERAESAITTDDGEQLGGTIPAAGHVRTALQGGSCHPGLEQPR